MGATQIFIMAMSFVDTAMADRLTLCDGMRLWRPSRDPNRIERLATG
jgi:hypothetical protein